VTELLLEMVVSGHAATVLPSWVAAGYLSTQPVRTIRMEPCPEPRVWKCATRRGVRSPAVVDFVELLRTHFASHQVPAGVL
ncbi:MAG: LysR family transcriptional regulator, partial [Acidimicrobiia bacterium]|nr:LysR family transcriptional regulator [Acidimicrobiia bacterium]